ncbi:MAG: DUF4286 family protein [Arcicella sp.]|nr:DUF4286 family protein [Arcicella sp.]
MLIHNITYNIDKSLETDFLNWMREVHIPNVMKTGFPKTFKVMRLLTEIDNGGSTFSVQYNFDSIDGFEVFENEYFDDLNAAVDKRYRGKYVFFASLLNELF